MYIQYIYIYIYENKINIYSLNITYINKFIMTDLTNARRKQPSLIAKCVQDHFLGELVNSMLRRSNNNNNNNGGNNSNVNNNGDSIVPVDVAVGNIESIGFQVGQRIVESRSRNAKMMADTMQVFRFICKDFWSYIFQKQVTRLKSNHFDTYVIIDDDFAWLKNVAPVGAVDFDVEVLKFLVFPCGLIRGALSNLGVSCTVNAECDELPKVKFTVKCLV